MSFVIGNINDSNILNTNKTKLITNSNYKIYGVSFDLNKSDGEAQFNAKGLRFTPSTISEAGIDDWINLESGNSPFGIKECITKYESGSRVVKAYKGESGYETLLNDSDTDVCIEFPLFYYKRPSKWTFLVSSQPVPGFSPSPMHCNNGGIIRNHAYVSKYKVNASLHSKSGQEILTLPADEEYKNIEDGSHPTIKYFRDNFATKGWYLFDYATLCSITMLMFIKYQTLDCQNKVGVGYSMANSEKTTTGGADGVLGMDGYAGSSLLDNAQIVAFGIEDFWGNVYSHVDGLQVYKNEAWINTDVNTMGISAETTSTSYIKAPDIKLPYDASNSYFSYIADLSYDTTFPWALLPTAYKSKITDTSGYNFTLDRGYRINDGFWMNKAVRWNGCQAGGDWGDGFACGPLYLDVDSPLSASRSAYGALASFTL